MVVEKGSSIVEKSVQMTDEYLISINIEKNEFRI